MWLKEWQQVSAHFPLQQREDWPLAGAAQQGILLRLDSIGQQEVAHVGVRLHRLRSLPGAWYLQVPKLGVGIPEWAVQATMLALRELAARWWRVARVRIELCLLGNPDMLAEFEREAKKQGYSVVPPLEYEHTLVVPLPETADQALIQFHRSVFKNTRKLERAGHAIRPITDQRYFDRLAALYAETMSRTGARVDTPDMVAVIRSAAQRPDRYHLLGLFHKGDDNPESLMAFRWCGRAGCYAFDLLAASTRLVDESGQIPMMPAIMLDMFGWARELGATHFDFGGVVLDGDLQGSAVAGISRFKMQFGGNVARVGSDLLLEPRLGWRILDRAQRIVRRRIEN
ncbi:GNAT family N-acetyltransferase [Gemmatimonas sp. UBA7669]|uniref:GNAT family N-acetyltransferase n=1 Tax=Gemmatimonas sp. UBA7669 TaxID=1946568 RepID=UPI0025BE92AA|nr:GNAT family N-acetyltransferase [Gemmatimonas sp. UBA7669]